MTGARGSSEVRAARVALVADATLRGVAFGRALSEVIDDAMRAVIGTYPHDHVALVALGSYARRELCPGSDLDVMLLHDGRGDIGALADAFWYPLWDAGFVLGHATRTVKESRKLAADDLDTLTGLLTARVVGGPLASEAQALIADARRLAVKRRAGLIEQLSAASRLRRLRPGVVAEMLEPNLKDGAGGLRDIQALEWAGWALGPPGGFEALEAADAVFADDLAMLAGANRTLLDARVALHRVTTGRSDVLALQDQDAVAAELGVPDADVMVRDLAAAARRVAWVADDAWSRLRAPVSRRSRRSKPDRDLADGVVQRDGRVHVASATIDGGLVVRAARAAAEHRLPIDRAALATLAEATTMQWDATTTADFVAALRAGRPIVEVFEALDHENLVRIVLPEWEHVRFRPQRNAYHRFTVDRHLLETVAEAASLLDHPDGPEVRGMAEELEDPAVLLLGALLHDIAKGRVGDHSALGAATARTVGTRLGLAPDRVDDLVWLVREHLLMADTATRRDLSDPVTIENFIARGVDVRRLRLLMVLTVADSRATGPAAWGPGKAALVRELADRTVAALAGRPIDAGASETALPEESFAGPGVVVQWESMDDGRWRCAVAADDRPGLLAGVAGALSLEGFDIATAEGHSLPGRRAAEVFVGVDTFDRFDDEHGRRQAGATIEGVLADRISVREGLEVRREAYATHGVDVPAPAAARVRVVQDASEGATVVEVFAPDEIGLLATVAGVISDLGFDVTLAKVATTGELAVDVFYVRDHGEKVLDAKRLSALEAELLAVLHRG